MRRGCGSPTGARAIRRTLHRAVESCAVQSSAVCLTSAGRIISKLTAKEPLDVNAEIERRRVQPEPAVREETAPTLVQRSDICRAVELEVRQRLAWRDPCAILGKAAGHG